MIKFAVKIVPYIVLINKNVSIIGENARSEKAFEFSGPTRDAYEYLSREKSGRFAVGGYGMF